MKYISSGEGETALIAKNLSAAFAGGEIILLSGFLGSGKTVFTKGIAQGLGINQTITSPTFTIMNVYEGKKGLKLCHCDAYRLTCAEDAGDITEYFGQKDCVSVIEWPDNLESFFDGQKTINVKINYIDAETREILID